MIAAVVRASRGRVPVIAGTGANSTREAPRTSPKRLKPLALDAFLQGRALTTTSPRKRAFFQHFRAHCQVNG